MLLNLNPCSDCSPASLWISCLLFGTVDPEIDEIMLEKCDCTDPGCSALKRFKMHVYA